MTKPGVSYTGVPRHLAALRTRLANVSRDSNVPQQRLEVLIASVVATQLVSDAVVKGGIALKLHGGDRATRFTTDVEMADSPVAVHPGLKHVHARAQSLCSGGFADTWPHIANSPSLRWGIGCWATTRCGTDLCTV